MSRLSDRIADAMIKFRWMLFAFGVLVSFVSLIGLSRIDVRNDFRTFIGEDSQALKDTDWLSQRLVDSVETAALIYLPADQRVFTDIGLIQYGQIAERAATLPHVKEARSFFDSDKLVRVDSGEGTPAKVVVAPFVSGPDIFSDAGRTILEGDARALPTIAGRYLSRDGARAAVTLSLDLSDDAEERLKQIAALRAEVDVLNKEVAGLRAGDRIVLAGSSLFDEASYAIFRHELPPLFLIAIAIVAGVLFLLYNSFAFVALALIVIFVPVAVTAGLCGLLGLQFSVLTASGLLLVGTLAVADVLHIANSYFLGLANGAAPRSALQEAIGRNLWAVCATSTTTAIGEAVLLFSASPAVQTMGLTIMVGVMTALVLALLLLPAPLMMLRGREARSLTVVSDAFAACAGFCARHARIVMLVFTCLMAASVYGALQARINDSVTAWFAPKVEFRKAMETYNQSFAGSQAVTLALETPLADVSALRRDPAAENSAALEKYRLLHRDLTAAAPGQWLSPIDAARAARERASAEATSLRIAPEAADGLKAATSDTVARSGLFTPFEPGRSDFSLWRSEGGADSSFATVAQAQTLETLTQERFPEREVRVAGLGYAFADVSVRNFYNIAASSLLIIAVVALCLTITFGSIKYGLWTLIPNTAPIIAIYGLWGMMEGSFNLAAITMFAVALGIVVDDTIHFVLHYRHARREGMSTQAAIRKSVYESSGGVLATTLVIIAGFALLAMTSFQLTAQKAAMTASAIGLALVFDVTMLPALLALIDADKEQSETATEN